MKKLLNTLYISTQGAYLSKDRESVIVKIEGKEQLRVPIIALGSIVCFGNVLMSPALMGMCSERNVTISFITEYGKFQSRVCGAVSGNIFLRKQQFRWSDDIEKSAEIAKNFIIAKIFNSRTSLQRYLRDHNPECEKVIKVSSSLYENLLYLKKNTFSLNELRGIEGECAKLYFSVFNNLIVKQKKYFYFHSRNRRPPLDNVNALLSFTYTILGHDIRSALESVGLDPSAGFLHRDRPGRHSLALDLMEEFRVYLADRFVLSLINLNKVSDSGFSKSECGSVTMSDKTKKILLSSYQERKKNEITHPFLKEKIKIGLLPYTQALLMARYIRGDIESYPPFLWR